MEIQHGDHKEFIVLNETFTLEYYIPYDDDMQDMRCMKILKNGKRIIDEEEYSEHRKPLNTYTLNELRAMANDLVALANASDAVDNAFNSVEDINSPSINEICMHYSNLESAFYHRYIRV